MITEAQFEYFDESQLYKIGINLATIHNFSTLRSKLFLPVQKTLYMSR
jgi:hypothetical protein